MSIHLECNSYVYTLAILWAGTWLNVLSRLALTPGGGSNTNTRPALSRFVGSFGFISIVKNNLNDGDGWRLEKTKKKNQINYTPIICTSGSSFHHFVGTSFRTFWGIRYLSILFDEAKARFARIFSGQEPPGDRNMSVTNLWTLGWLGVDTYFSLWQISLRTI